MNGENLREGGHSGHTACCHIKLSGACGEEAGELTPAAISAVLGLNRGLRAPLATGHYNSDGPTLAVQLAHAPRPWGGSLPGHVPSVLREAIHCLRPVAPCAWMGLKISGRRIGLHVFWKSGQWEDAGMGEIWLTMARLTPATGTGWGWSFPSRNVAYDKV